MALDEGLLFASDSRTNAGVDHVSTFSKMAVFEKPGERAIVLLNSGNLATTQTVVNRVRKQISHEDSSLMTVESMFDAAELVGRHLREVIISHCAGGMQQSGIDFSALFLVGGQIGDEAPRLFLLYPQGNFIETCIDTPFFQIGESKYGKPIIDRVVKPETPLNQALKCALVSFDSTMRSNLSVGLPIDIALIRRDARAVSFRHRVDSDDRYFAAIRNGWSQGLRKVFNELPAPDWLKL
jgi:putative proteasome-type protease